MVPLLDPISVNSVTWDKSLRYKFSMIILIIFIMTLDSKFNISYVDRKSSIATNSLLTGSYYRQQEDAKLISKGRLRNANICFNF